MSESVAAWHGVGVMGHGGDRRDRYRGTQTSELMDMFTALIVVML